ncbi:DNA breaking-rejoining protein, partial [Salmonella enterica]|nr:DNA breaking-rejoining protein [Salmonella enterica]EAM4673965.1 DNA breaking-rejoining protein [Salmonella enterica]EAY7144936.1 DNA breaking-rejoining protein [Salmonella enterica]
DLARIQEIYVHELARDGLIVAL